MKRKFNKGDIVLCTQFSIGQNRVIDECGIKIVPCIDDGYFNRRAYISKTYKECMEQTLGGIYEDKDEYEITFLDDGNSLAWVKGKDLVLLMRNDCIHEKKDYEKRPSDTKEEILEKIIHFFEMEIERVKSDKNNTPVFNNVSVGIRKSNQLIDRHIVYCQNIIDGIRSGKL